MIVCSVEGCEHALVKREWCNKHYLRWKRYGNPLGGHTFHGEPLAYLQAHMYDGCCYPWPFAKISGYSQIVINRKNVLASKYVCERVNPTPEKQSALHKCGKGHLGCFNADCLYWGNYIDNKQDAIEHGTWAHGEKQGHAKLFIEQIEEIRQMYVTGNYTQRVLAYIFDVSQPTIFDIVNFKTRRNG